MPPQAPAPRKRPPPGAGRRLCPSALTACRAFDFARRRRGNECAARGVVPRDPSEEDAMAALRSGLVTLAILLGLGLRGRAAGRESGLARSRRAQQEKAQQTEAGRAGTTEPSSQAPTAQPDESCGFRQNGRLATPGAPADSQTVPAKFSERNNALDELPTMAFPLPLTDEQRQRIRDAVSKAPVESANARVRRSAAERHQRARAAGSAHRRRFRRRATSAMCAPPTRSCWSARPTGSSSARSRTQARQSI